MKLVDIVPAAWNTRGEIKDEDVVELVKSIHESGLINPITLWEDADGRWCCIAGNRRLKALELLGCKELLEGKDYTVFDGDEMQAWMVTITENLQRESIDPIAEAALVGEMIERGCDIHDIAARIGKGDKWVARRAKLMTLDGKIAEKVRECPSRFSVAALEMIAELPEKSQSEVAGRIIPRLGWSQDWILTTKEASDEIVRVSQDIDLAAFSKDEAQYGVCVACAKRTGCQADLFGVADGKLGRCLDGKCFKKAEAAHEAKLVAAAVPKGVEAVRLRYAWEMPREAQEKRDKAHPCAFYTVYGGEVEVKWGPSKKEADEAKEKAEAERREANAEVDAVRSRVRDIVEKMEEAFPEGDKYPDGLVGAVSKMIEKDLPQDEREFVIDIIANWMCQWHDADDYAEMLTHLPFTQTLSGISDSDKEFLIQNKDK